MRILFVSCCSGGFCSMSETSASRFHNTHWPPASEGCVERALRRGNERRGGNKQRPQRNRPQWKARSTQGRTAEISFSIHVASLPKCRSSQKPKPELESDLLQHHLVALFQPA